MRWNDRWPDIPLPSVGGAEINLDLFLYEEVVPGMMTMAYQSNDSQNGEEDHYPREIVEIRGNMADSVTGPETPTFYIRVKRRSRDAIPTWVQLNHFSGPNTDGSALQCFTLPGSILNPAESANEGMLAVGSATESKSPEIGTLSARGPTPDGRIKPDVVADGRTDPTRAGTARSLATSQASARVAGLAALAIQRFGGDPNYDSPAEIASFLKDHARHPEGTGPDNTWGHGFAHLPPPPTASFSASSYQVFEGGEVSVAVNLNPGPDQEVEIPITVTADPGTETDDYTVSGLSEEGTLRFASGEITQSFTITARLDADEDNETVSLGFGTLPPGVVAGTPASATMTLFDVLGVPNTLRNLQATRGDGQVTLTWETPSASRSASRSADSLPDRSPLTGYEYRQSTDGGSTWLPDWTAILDDDPAMTSYTLEMLTNGVEYTFEVRAVNDAGAGAASRVSATPAGVPDPPILSLEAANKLTLRIRLGAANGAPITSTERRIYTLDSTTGDTTWVYSQGGRWFSSSLDPSAAYYSSMFTTGWGTLLSNLSTNVEYTFEVRSVNSAGRSAVARVTYKPDEVELSATGGRRSVTLSWEGPDDSDITDWEYNWREGSSGSWGGWTHIAGSHEGTTSHVVDGLKNSTLYEFQVRSKEGSAVGLISNVASATTLSPEVDLSGVAGNEEVDLSWAYTGSVALTGWQYRRSTDRGATWTPDWSSIPDSDGATRSFKVGSLSNGQEYTFAVRGLVNGVWKVESDTVLVTPDGVELSATGGRRSVTLSWEDPLDSDITDWEYNWREGSSGEWEGWEHIAGSHEGTTSHEVGGLKNSTSYEFQVRSKEGIAVGLVSNVASATTLSPEVDLSGVAGNEEVDLSWAYTGSVALTGWQYRRSTDRGATWTPDWSSIPDSDGATRSFKVGSLSNGQEYTFAVRGLVNGVWKVESDTVLVTPDGVELSASVGQRSVTLSWEDPLDSDITDWEYNRREGSSGEWEGWEHIAGSHEGTTSHEVGGLKNSTSYEFQVRSKEGIAVGLVSNVASATTLPPEVDLSGVAGNGKVDLSWDYTGDVALTGWQYRRSTDREATWMPDWTLIEGSTTSTRSYEVGSLSNGQEYTFAVRGVFNGISKVESDTVSATPAGEPVAPGNLQASAGDAEVTLSWETPSANGSPLTGYQYRQSTDGGTSWLPDWGSISLPAGTAVADFDRHTIKDLSNGVEHTFEVRAVNTVGAGDSSRVMATPAGVPDPPIVSTRLASNGSTLLHIRLGATNGSPITGTERRIYTIDSTTGDTTWVFSPAGGRWNFISIDPTELNHSSRFTDGWNTWISYLTSNVEYTFEVRSVNSVGRSAIARVTHMPGEFVLSASAGDGEVDLSWVYTGNAALTGWEYRRSTDKGRTWMPDWSSIAGSTTSTRSYEVGSLSNGQEYTFAVRGVFNGVWKVESDTVSATPDGVDLSGEAGNGEVDLSWSYTGSVALTGWQYRQSTDRGAMWTPDWSSIPGSDGATRSFKVGSLSNGQEYTFAVRGLVGEVGRVESDTVLVTPDGVGLSASVGQRSVRLSWEDPLDSDITDWEYNRREGSSGEWEGWKHIAGSHDGTTSHEVGGLKNSTDYEFQVRSKEGIAVGLVSNVVSVTTPPAEVDLSGEAGYEAADLSWSYTGSVALTGWQYRRSTDRGGTWAPDWSSIPGSDGATRSFKVGSLSNGQEYTFAVRGLVGEVGRVESDTVLVTPKGVRLSAEGGQRSVRLSWEDPLDSDITDWEYNRREGSSGEWEGWKHIAGSHDGTTSHEVGGLKNSTDYEFQVRSKEGIAVGLVSNVAPATTFHPEVDLSGEAGNGEVDLSWSYTGSVALTGWQYRQSTDRGAMWTPDWSSIPGSDGATRSFKVGSLSNGQEYTFAVRGLVGEVWKVESDTVLVTPDGVGLSASVGQRSVRLSWEDPLDSDITDWEYNRREGSSGEWEGWKHIAGSHDGTTSHEVGGLKNSTDYEFQVRSKEGIAVGLVSNVVSVTTPPAEVDLSGEAGYEAADLSWSYTGSVALTGWQYRRSTDRGGTWAPDWSSIPGSDGATRSFKVGSLSNGQEYTFAVRGLVGEVWKVESDTVLVTPDGVEVVGVGWPALGEVELGGPPRFRHHRLGV